jgi:hypothetical protein
METNHAFYSDRDFSYEMKMMREYWVKDNRYRVTIIGIDMVKSKVHNLYGEAKARDKKFLEPVTLPAKVKLAQSVTKQMSAGGATKEDYEDFSFSVFIADLKENNVDIKRGDFAAYFDGEAVRLFEIATVTNLKAGNLAGGYKPYFIKCTGSLVKEDAVPNNLKDIL